jgi:carboxymethylenebutenolidase
VVIHDALGMSRDVRNQADWLAGEGFPRGGATPSVLGRADPVPHLLRDWGRPVSDLEATRAWLAEHERCTGCGRRRSPGSTRWGLLRADAGRDALDDEA